MVEVRVDTVHIMLVCVIHTIFRVYLQMCFYFRLWWLWMCRWVRRQWAPVQPTTKMSHF